jgi:hypothetical protein
MPRHQQVTTCLRGGGAISKHCPCSHCTLSVCSVCGAYEGSLTTDCPGEQVDHDRRQEVYETALDYTDVRGWHLGEPTKFRAPRFASMLPPEPPSSDPRGSIAPSIDWGVVDRASGLEQELARRGVAWVLADETCDDRATAIARIEDEVAEHVLGDVGNSLLTKLEREKIDFQIACRDVERRDDEFRQVARQLVAVLRQTTKVA